MLFEEEDIIGKRPRAQKRIIRVTFPDGTIFCYKNATITFTEALRKIGADKVAEVTGRSKRVVTKTDENGNPIKVEESMAQPSFRMAETKAFLY